MLVIPKTDLYMFAPHRDTFRSARLGQLRPLGILACVCLGFLAPANAAVVDYALPLRALTRTDPPAVTLAWPANSTATAYTLSRKDPSALRLGRGPDPPGRSHRLHRRRRRGRRRLRIPRHPEWGGLC